MTKIKICGITNLEDALFCASAGADALGFNFFSKSPRYIAPQAVKNIIGQLPDNIKKVGVFVNESIENVTRIAAGTGIDSIQLHGTESPAFVSVLSDQIELPVIKAFRVSDNFDVNDISNYKTHSVLLDAYSVTEYGGTGEVFDWETANRAKEIVPRLYLAGGLTPQNVSSAIKLVDPYAVDVCSGVESSKGIKDHQKVILFVANVRDL